MATLATSHVNPSHCYGPFAVVRVGAPDAAQRRVGGRLAGAAAAQPDDGVRREGALGPHAQVVAQARAHLRPQGQRHLPLRRVAHPDEPGMFRSLH